MAMLGEKAHTSSDFEHELAELRRLLLNLGAHVEQMTAESIESLVKRDAGIAEKVIAEDEMADGLESDINELCMRMMALRQPTAGDLRFITTGLKIASDLERVGDLATNISKRSLELLEEPPLKPYIEIPRMAQATQKMLKDSLDSFLNADTAGARVVIESDDEVDNINEELFRELITYMMQDTRNVSRAMRLSFVSKTLERIADHSTNIAESVIFMVEGVPHHQKS